MEGKEMETAIKADREEQKQSIAFAYEVQGRLEKSRPP